MAGWSRPSYRGKVRPLDTAELTHLILVISFPFTCGFENFLLPLLVSESRNRARPAGQRPPFSRALQLQEMKGRDANENP